MKRRRIEAEAIVSRRVTADAYTPSGDVDVIIELPASGSGTASLTFESPMEYQGHGQAGRQETVTLAADSEKLLDYIDGMIACLATAREALVSRGWIADTVAS